MSSAIEDYAMIGDCRSAALVSRSGSIDWLCWPRFESPSIFGALLDSERGGTWSIRPRGAFISKRRYLGDSAVLETVFESGGAEIVVTDAMPIASEHDARTMLTPEHELVRIIECRRGSCTVEVRLSPRPRFGEGPFRVRDRGKLGLRFETPDGLLTLLTDAAESSASSDGGVTWSLSMHAGDAVHYSLSWTVDSPAVLPPLGAWTRASVERTLRHWNTWASRTCYDGADRAQVVRSAITVRLLAYSPSGAIIAAPTTSLPETIGGALNWDYRYCWLRDAAFTVRGLLELGHPEEARAFADWLLHATRLTHPRLLVLYDVFGRAPAKERELPGLAGYEGSRPVRVGNGADHQLQLDSYGEVIDSVWRIACAGIPLDKTTAEVIEGFGRYVCEHWPEPDSGIWEPRGRPSSHTHSLALCWTALDRLLDLQKRGMVRRRNENLFSAQRGVLAQVLRERGYNQRIGSYTAELDGTALDATSLLLGWYGFESPASRRMRSTHRRVMASLSPRPGLLYRNRTETSDEGAFGICSFWIAEHLARGGGTLAEARAAYRATTAFANDVDLMAEEIDPQTGRALGNFPQTFTHVGWINAALSIAARERQDAT